MNILTENWKYLAVFFIGVLSSAIGISYFLYFFSLKKKNRKQSQTSSNPFYYYYEATKIEKSDFQKNLNTQKEEFQRKISKLEKLIAEKENEIQKLKDDLQASSNIKIGSTIDLELVDHNQINTNTIFFSVPTEKGTFPNEKGSKIKSDTTWYKIEYKENETTGELYFLPGKADKRALNQLDYYLNPVCEIDNPLYPNPQKIDMLEPGKIVLKDNQWIIEKKLKLKLR